jgi:hypothetical protein
MKDIGCSTEQLACRYQPSKNDSTHYTFLSFFTIIIICYDTLPESLHPITKSLMQDPVVNTPNTASIFLCEKPPYPTKARRASQMMFLSGSASDGR